MIRDSLQDDLFAVISNDAIHAATRRASKRPLNNRNIDMFCNCRRRFDVEPL